jgi:hypothetical protein
MAVVFSNSPIDDNIIRYLALRSLLLHNYFLSFDTYTYLTFCFDLDFKLNAAQWV